MQIIEAAYRAYLTNRAETGGLRRLEAITPCSEKPGYVLAPNLSPEPLFNFSSNDYLGLSRDRRLLAAGRAFAETYGAGSASSRLVTGDFTPFQAVEAQTARLKKREAALIFSSGFSAEAGVVAALLDKSALNAEPLVFFDKLNHAGLYFGANAAGVTPIRFKHNDLNHLETLLKKHADPARPIFLMTESVFSMDGDIAPLAELCALSKRYEAFILVDDAHAGGVLGEGGAGLASAHPEIEAIMGTFSKGFGCFGGYVACSRVIRDYLLQKCAPFIYSTAPPPFFWGMIAESLKITASEEGESLRQDVARKSALLRQTLRAAGADIGASATHIVPVITGDTQSATRLSERFLEKGLYSRAIRPPTVPPASARLRLAVNPFVTDGMIEEISLLKNALPA